MRKIKVTLSLLLILAMMVSMTACTSVKETFSATKVSASSPSDLLYCAAEKYKSYESVDSVNITADFAINLNENNCFKGNMTMDGFFTEMKAKGLANISINDKSAAYDVYLSGTNVIYSLDGSTYKKIDISKLAKYSDVDATAILDIIQSITANGNTDLSNVDVSEFNNIDISGLDDIFSDMDIETDEIDMDSFNIEEINIEDILTELANYSEIFTLDGTKEINGKEVYVLKATIDLAQILAMVSQNSEIPETNTDLGTLDMEIYIGTSNCDFGGIYVNLNNMISAVTGTEPAGDNYIQVGIGINNANDFTVPEAEDAKIFELISTLTKITSMFGGINF